MFIKLSLLLARSMALNVTVFNWTYSLDILWLPHRHNKLLRNNASRTLHLTPYLTTLSSSFHFSEITWHNRLTNIVVSLPIPPIIEKTRGVNENFVQHSKFWS